MKCFLFDFYTFTDDKKNIARMVLHQKAENKLKAMREVFDTSKTGLRLCLHKPHEITECLEHGDFIEPKKTELAEDNPWGN